ncbi:MAG: hypothetical protein COW56_00425, partial [Rhodocyclales bacterium CG17_big_fil_post_rev_8_21_14_2_50_68_7]
PGSGTTSGGGNTTGSATPGASGASNGERNGSGGINKYNDSDSAQVTLFSPAIVKFTPSPTLYTIGDKIVYDILITLPEGVIQEMAVEDNLPVGLVHISNQVITTTAGSGGRLALDFAGLLPVPVVNTAADDGNDVIWDFGSASVATDNVAENNSFLL